MLFVVNCIFSLERMPQRNIAVVLMTIPASLSTRRKTKESLKKMLGKYFYGG
jgi:ABC-type iron transport system FetAB permease component